jgi:Apea-like HEPN
VLGTYDLPSSEGSAFIELWQSLASPRVTKRKPLTTALRRLTFAGERSRPEDQIIDLMIAAEAVFLAGEMTESANKLALRSAVFLRNDSRSVREVFRHMKRGYNARSRLAHGGGRSPNSSSPTAPPQLSANTSTASATTCATGWRAFSVRRPTERACRRATGIPMSSTRCPRRGCGHPAPGRGRTPRSRGTSGRLLLSVMRHSR